MNPGNDYALYNAIQNRTGLSYQEAARKNMIYQGNGLVCQRRMCLDMNGCEDVTACGHHSDYSKIVNFCGPIGTPATAIDGGWWRLEPSNVHQLMLTAAEKATGMNPLPTPWNTAGMY